MTTVGVTCTGISKDKDNLFQVFKTTTTTININILLILLYISSSSTCNYHIISRPCFQNTLSIYLSRYTCFIIIIQLTNNCYLNIDNIVYSDAAYFNIYPYY